MQAHFVFVYYSYICVVIYKLYYVNSLICPHYTRFIWRTLKRPKNRTSLYGSFRRQSTKSCREWRFSKGKGTAIAYRPGETISFAGGWSCQIWQSAHESGKFISFTHRSPLLNSKYFWYSFLLKAESTPVYSAAGRVMSMKNSNYTTANRTCDIRVCGAVHQYFNVGTRWSTAVGTV
jgi:hypothetical protein